jgi:hypothetical protein
MKNDEVDVMACSKKEALVLVKKAREVLVRVHFGTSEDYVKTTKVDAVALINHSWNDRIYECTSAVLTPNGTLYLS